VTTDGADALMQRWVRSIPDWPEPGVTFRDLTPLFADGPAFGELVRHLSAAAADFGPIDAVVGIEARGFILGAPVAVELGAGFIPIRKAGKLPGDVHAVSYALEYGEATMEMHTDALSPGHRIVLLDDVLATGGTLAASAELIARSGATVVGTVVAMELSALNGRATLGAMPLTALTQY
jgi:adenine phosphoribosyltransferase